MFISVAAGMGMSGIFLRTLHHKTWMISLMAALMLLAPSLSLAEVSILKGAPARGLIGSDGSQPMSLSVAQWVTALGNIRYADETIFASDNPKAVFSGQQIHTLAPQLQQALVAIRAGQALAFHAGRIRGEVFFSHGSLYWYFSRIQNSPAFDLILLAKEEIRTSYVIETVSEDDIDVSYWSLLPWQGQSLYRGRPDMLAMPVSTLMVKATNTSEVVKQLESTQQPDHPLARQATDVNRPDADSRINTLRGFLDRNLITKHEYEQKLEAIIAEYEQQYPSPEVGLEFLQRLDKKGLIAPAILHKQQKLLLDRL